MKDRGLLFFCLLVGAAIYSLRGPEKPTLAPSSSAIQQQATPVPVAPSAKPKLDLDAVEDSLGPEPPKPVVAQSDPVTLLSSNTERMFVSASRVNVRANPGTASSMVARLASGTEVRVVEVREGWSRVKTRDGKVSGWVSSNYLTRQSVNPPQVEKRKVQPPVKLAKPTFNRSKVVSEIIESSLASYSGNCPCPYNTMRNGRRCGGRSAYSRPGGESPLCYPQDVSEEMIQQWVSR